MTEQEPKLTVEEGRGYAGSRSKATMPEPSKELFILPVEQERPTRTPAPERREHRFLQNPEQRKPSKPEKKGIFDILPGRVEDLVVESVESKRDKDTVFSYMALELNEQTKKQPLKEWSDVKIALWYDEWKEFAEDIDGKKKKKDATPEEVSRDQSIYRVVEGVKEALVADAKDKASITEGTLLQKKAAELVDGEEIATPKVKRAFDKFMIRITNGDKISVREQSELREQWRELQKEFDGELGKDKEGRKAIDKIRSYLSTSNKELAARREERPPRIQARADTSEEQPSGHHHMMERRRREQQEEAQRKEEEARKKREKEEEESDPEAQQRKTKTERAHASIESSSDSFSSYSTKAEKLRGKEAEEAKKAAMEEARKRWREEKSKMVKHTEMMERLSFDYEKYEKKEDKDAAAKKNKEANALWKKYGWTPEHRQEVAEVFGFDQKRADLICQGLLLRGVTGKEARETAEEKKAKIAAPNTGAHREVAFEFRDDGEDVALALGIPPETIEAVQESSYREEPTSMQETAWQIALRRPEVFGEGGEHPVWERRYQEVDSKGRVVDPDTGKVRDGDRLLDPEGQIKLEMREHVNKDNILLWFRDRVNYAQEAEPNERHNFYQKIAIQKEPYSYSFEKMLSNMEVVFAGSSTEQIPDRLKPPELRGKVIKEDYLDLSDMMNIEAYLLTMVRNFHLAYDENKGSDEEVYKQMQQLYNKNHLTRSLWGGKPLWQFMTLLPENFTTLDKMDGGVGASVVKSYLTYYHLSDFEKLQEVLGPDAGLFNVQTWMDTRDKMVSGSDTRFEEAGIINKDKEYFDFSYTTDEDGKITFNNKLLQNAFDAYEYTDKDGNKKINSWVRKTPREKDKGKDPEKAGKDDFIAIVNIFNNYTPNPEHEKMIKKIILKDAGADEELNDINQQYAHLIADHLVRFTGAAANNDTSFVGYDAMTRLIHCQGYRSKMLKGEEKEQEFEGMKEKWTANRGGKVGNIHTVDQFKSLIVNPMLGIVTQSKGQGEFGSYDKPLLHVLEELNAERNKLRKELKEKKEEREKGNVRMTDKEKQKEKEEVSRNYRKTARQLRFVSNAEQHYLQNQFNRGVELNKIIRGGENKLENLDQFFHYSPEVGVTFDRKKFQDAIVGMITDTRYAFSTYGKLGYNAIVRGYDYEKKGWRDMSLAEAMFGRNMLNVKDFISKDGHIDPQRIHTKTHVLYKQFLMTYIAGEIIASRQIRKWSTDPRHDFMWYMHILEAIEKIPGDFDTHSDKDMRDLKIGKFFFEHENMKWLMNTADLHKRKLIMGNLLKGFFLGDRKKKGEGVFDGLGDAMGKFISAVFSGK